MKYYLPLLCLIFLACDQESKPSSEKTITSQARPSNSVSPVVEVDPFDEAYSTLRRDAFRREERFRNALQPGYLFQRTRLEQSEVRAKHWSVEELYQLGGQLFDLSFTHAEGLGTGRLKRFRRVHLGNRSNLDAVRCTACHWRGGVAGAGDASDNVYFAGDGDRPSSGLERNAPALAGVGALELMAKTLSAQLHQQREDLIKFTRNAGYAVRESLKVQGIDFGHLTVYPNGTIKTDEIMGVDPDLIIKPFGRKGQLASLREMIEESLFIHHGLQSEWAVDHWSRERLGDGPKDDPDNDGVIREITEGQITALTIFLALQSLPIIEPPEDTRLISKWGNGRIVFETIGCADCHKPTLKLSSSVYQLVDREVDDEFNFDLQTHGPPPRLSSSTTDEGIILRLFSDLKRHKMSSEMADSKPSGLLAADVFITPPLWGLARSRPYMHDGRAPTIEAAILLHGGEAQSSRDAFAALEPRDLSSLRIFLMSLTRAKRFTAH